MQWGLFLSHTICDYISTYINTSNYRFVLKRSWVIIRNNILMNDLIQPQKYNHEYFTSSIMAHSLGILEIELSKGIFSIRINLVQAILCFDQRCFVSLCITIYIIPTVFLLKRYIII